MIEILPESEGPFIGLKIKGELTHKAYQATIPVLEKKINQYGKISLLLDLKGFKGWQMQAAIDDIRFAFKHRKDIRRVALVFEEQADLWACAVDQPFARGVQGKEKGFPASQIKQAWKWLKKDTSSKISLYPQYKSSMGKHMRLLIVGQHPLAYAFCLCLCDQGFHPVWIGGGQPQKNKTFLNFNYASLSLLEALGISEWLAKKINSGHFQDDGKSICGQQQDWSRLFQKALQSYDFKFTPKRCEQTCDSIIKENDHFLVSFKNRQSETFNGIFCLDPAIKNIDHAIHFQDLGLSGQLSADLERLWYLAHQLRCLNGHQLSSHAFLKLQKPLRV